MSPGSCAPPHTTSIGDEGAAHLAPHPTPLVKAEANDSNGRHEIGDVSVGLSRVLAQGSGLEAQDLERWAQSSGLGAQGSGRGVQGLGLRRSRA